jgi:hypothetical protein
VSGVRPAWLSSSCTPSRAIDERLPRAGSCGAPEPHALRAAARRNQG